MERILVLRGGALGDFLVTLPALEALRQRWPQARIELAGNATAAQLARARGLVDVVHSQHDARWSALYGETPLPHDFATWLDGFDLVVSYWPDPDAELRRRFPRHARQTFVVGEALPSRGPAAAHYCEPLRALGLEPRRHLYPLAPLNPAAPSVRNSVMVHPGSGSPRKNWPAENWLALMPQLPSPLALILGEPELENGWATRAPHGTEILVGAPLETLVDRLSACRLFLGHDSGISHLAAQCGAPCVLLFGPTAPPVWAPPAPNVRVLQRGPDLRAISVAEVSAAVTAALTDRS